MFEVWSQGLRRTDQQVGHSGVVGAEFGEAAFDVVEVVEGVVECVFEEPADIASAASPMVGPGVQAGRGGVIARLHELMSVSVDAVGHDEQGAAER